jgi:hypothetical protein
VKTRWLLLRLLLLPTLGRPPAAVAQAAAPADRKPWAERLGWPPDKRVLSLHADDLGMCYEANAAAQRALSRGEYRSASAMVCRRHPRPRRPFRRQRIDDRQGRETVGNSSHSASARKT